MEPETTVTEAEPLPAGWSPVHGSKKWHFFCAIALAVLLALAANLFGAPVPPAPKQLDRTAFVGVWKYGYGSQADGVMHLCEDATYYSVHRVDAETAYVGTWHVEGATLVLHERALNLDTGRMSSAGIEYRITFDRDKLPARFGRSQHGTTVTLTRIPE
jgi:hypothetical protein